MNSLEYLEGLHQILTDLIEEQAMSVLAGEEHIWTDFKIHDIKEEIHMASNQFESYMDE